MFNIFQQSWTLLISAAMSLLVLYIIRDILADKKIRYLWLIPIILALAGFCLDYFIKTDLEQINLIIETCSEAFENENYPALTGLLCPDYRDSYHKSPEELLSYCRALLREPLIETNKILAREIEITASTAKAVIVVWTFFDKQGFVYQYKPMQLTKLKLHLVKNRPNSLQDWEIKQIDILEVDHKKANWSALK